MNDSIFIGLLLLAIFGVPSLFFILLETIFIGKNKNMKKEKRQHNNRGVK